ncbi:MAG: pyrroloquinoline quinone biosynthesis protein PqqB [Myxococcales bacterium]|nr:MAG: pyrroloquinoline quinone biosynthesis protein PqqB [Myxococcales bacterium]
MALHVLVLGSAAGGGFPQWNCGCQNCQGVRAGKPGLRARTQDSVAISGDGESWFLLNASPDVLRQVQDNRELWPRNLRDSPILGVVLTNGDLDHVLGLLQLRESQPLALYATERVLAGLADNAALRTLQRFEGHLRQHPLRLDEPCELQGARGEPSGVFVTAAAVRGKPPLHLSGLYAPSIEDNVALRVRTAESGTLVYASAIADAGAAQSLLEGCAALLLDGTFWSEEELPELGVRMGPARSMAHQPVGGSAGSLLALRELRAARRIFTHLNNTNPLLDDASPERREVSAAGWEVATDGLRLRLD